MKQDDKLFLLGLTSLVLSLFLFPCALYLFPMAWFGWQYTVPDFILNFALWIEQVTGLSYKFSFIWVMRVIFISSFTFGGIAYFISRKLSEETKKELKSIEEARAESDLVPARMKESSRESVVMFLKLVAFASLVFLIGKLMQWAISVSA